MKKFLFIALCSIAFTQTQAQKLYGTRNAKVSFIATNDEDVKAVNNEVASRLSDKGEISFSLLIKGFKFEYAEMQEKFNNDYVESNKFPRAEFKGTISNIKDINFTKDGSYKAVVKGNLTLHGVSKPVTVNGTITVKAGKVSATGKFPIVMKDHKIEASAVTEKVNAEINAVYQ
ncbi:YceI family protein [Sediminibacterium sp. C3]|uniref:YceI family protein n=1 Tax=Sediminibacterium sp. C3 TaxID=1267211 RepID=UPI0003FC6459|nr:YceI family protein [Sediminibacterium sp. C3]